MRIVIGADHRGFALKEAIRSWLKQEGYTVEDVGAEYVNKDDDYVDFAKEVGKKVQEGDTVYGLLFCGSGIGMAIAANRLKGVRSAVATDIKMVQAGRHDDDINTLSIPADFTTEQQAKELITAFLTTPFGQEERYKRRLQKIEEIQHA